MSAPSMFAFVMLAFVKSAFERLAPLRLAFMNDAPDASRRTSVEPDKSALLKMEFRTFAPERSVLCKPADVKLTPFIVAFLMVDPDKSALVILAFVTFELLKLELPRFDELKFVFVIVELASDAPLRSTSSKPYESVTVESLSIIPAWITVIVAVILVGASYNVPCPCEATITAEPGAFNLMRPVVGCIVRMVELGS